MPGAKVTVTDPDGNSTDYVTDKDGMIILEDLEEGAYDITVKEVPEGYTVTTGKTATVVVEAGKTAVHEAFIIPSIDTDVETPNTDNSTDTSQTKTGDAFNMILPVAMILVSLAGAAVIANRRRKRY